MVVVKHPILKKKSKNIDLSEPQPGTSATCTSQNKIVFKILLQPPGFIFYADSKYIYKTFKLSKIKSFELCNYNFMEILDTTTKKKFGLLEDED